MKRLVPCGASEKIYSGSKLPAERSHEGVNKFMIGLFSSRDLGVNLAKKEEKSKFSLTGEKRDCFPRLEVKK